MKKRKFKRKGKVWVGMISVIILGLFLFGIRDIFKPIPFSNRLSMYGVNVDLDGLKSQYVFVVDGVSKQTVNELDSDKKIYPASMTKMMTAIVTLEHFSDFEMEVKIPSGIMESLYEEGASLTGFCENEVVKVKDIVYGMMLSSGADATITAAVSIAGSEEEFVKLMNKKAKELGMINTHFVNSSGLHDDEHYTTLHDLELLLEYAVQNENFMEVMRTPKYTTTATSFHPNGIKIESKLHESMEKMNHREFDFVGGKTGFTYEAGLCLASMAYVNEKPYYVITAKANGVSWGYPYHIEDASLIYRQLAIPLAKQKMIELKYLGSR